MVKKNLVIEDGDIKAESLSSNTSVPVASIFLLATSTVPSGFFECDGSAKSRTTYSDLFAAIGTTYGVGDGSTTFNIPDLRGEFVRGWDHGKGVDSGRAIGSYQADELKSHNHGYTYPGGSVSAGTGGFGGRVGTSTGSTGGTETRPRNIALMGIIKY